LKHTGEQPFLLDYIPIGRRRFPDEKGIETDQLS
jgi:hypothetical protein